MTNQAKKFERDCAECEAVIAALSFKAWNAREWERNVPATDQRETNNIWASATIAREGWEK